MKQVVVTRPAGAPANGCGFGLVSPGTLKLLESAADGTLLLEDNQTELVLQIVVVR
jgi:hypothetical protein